jgi:diguanylate cyclase (GGDEF)-like protein
MASGRRLVVSPAQGRTAKPAILRFTTALAVLVITALLLCTGLAYLLAKQADDFLEAEHRQALGAALEALQAVSADLRQVEPGLIRVLERASGLKNLRFELEPAQPPREVQPVMDEKGRIIGWFSWELERPASATMNRLIPFAALIAMGLIGFAALAMWQLGRLGVQLAETERHAQKLALEDVLTGLPNHDHFLAVLDQAVAQRQNAEVLAFAVLDLDGFDEINDALGHAGGDEVLAQAARRLAESLPAGATLGRLGSDEFALLIADRDAQAALVVTDALRRSLLRPFWINQVVQVSVSIGLAVAPRDGITRDELMRRADLALRTAKRHGRGTLVSFAAEMEAELHERRFIRRELSRALATQSFDIHYQPIVRADGGGVSGVEALLRWKHPTRGFISPAEFVPVAEEEGLMDRLGEFALRRAIADATGWPGLYVSVNLSPVQVRDRALVEVVSTILRHTGFAPSRLVLEITESVLIENPDETTGRLEQLRSLGVQLALDDFGSGYSSLSYLQKLPFDKLKVDRSFVTALSRSANGGVIIQAIVALGRALGMGIVIEGVETEEERVLLRLAGCNEMQGYLFSRPVAREEIDRLLQQRIDHGGLMTDAPSCPPAGIVSPQIAGRAERLGAEMRVSSTMVASVAT